MRKSFRFRRKFRLTQEPPRYRVNERITAPEVRLVDEEDVNHGIVPTTRARAMAEERGLDLIEVSPKAEPPVAKIANYGSFKYQEEKQRQKQKTKQKKVEVKGIRLSLSIGAHDKEVRLKQAQEFFEEGHRIKIEIILRGRQRQHTDIGKKVIDEFVEALGQGIVREGEVTRQGNRLAAVVGKTS